MSPGIPKISNLGKKIRRGTTLIKSIKQLDSEGSEAHKDALDDRISESSGDMETSLSLDKEDTGKKHKDKVKMELKVDIIPDQDESTKKVIEREALNKQMTQFNVSELFNKAKHGIKLPVVKPNDNNLPVDSTKNQHLDYYKTQKEKFKSKQAQIMREQALVHETLK